MKKFLSFKRKKREKAMGISVQRKKWEEVKLKGSKKERKRKKKEFVK